MSPTSPELVLLCSPAYHTGGRDLGKRVESSPQFFRTTKGINVQNTIKHFSLQHSPRKYIAKLFRYQISINKRF